MSERQQDKVQPARRVAFDVIRAVSESDAYANLLLPVRIRRAALSTADAGLATELTYGTLRMRGYYDRVLAIASNRDTDAIDPPILDALRLGAHQLLSMRVAPHAAVNESVALARTVGSRSAAGFTNGVLREVTRRSPEQWRETVLDSARNDDERLSLEFSHPVWIVRAFRQALAAQSRSDELIDLLDADNEPAQVNLTALPGLATPPPDGEPNTYSPIGFTLGGGDPASALAGHGGALRVQDEGSQLAALALSRARPIATGERWLDLCAGPGGKAAVLAAEALGAGATLVANELIPARVGLVERSVVAAASVVEIWNRDGCTIGDSDPESFDRILLDAPCTGLGALRRRPEARWRKTPRDVAELAGLQSALLDSAVMALKPGGVLAYVTCSPHLGESRLAVLGALKRWDSLEEVDTQGVMRDIVRHPADLGPSSMQVQLWPHLQGTDAMFIALLTKRAGPTSRPAQSVG